MAFGLGLIAQEQGPTVGLPDHAVETFAQGVVAVLGAGDFDIAIAGEALAHGVEGIAAAVEGLVEAGGEEAGLEAGGAEESLLGEGHALEGEEFLGVDGLVDGGEVGREMGDLVQVFEADDGEGGGGEAVRAGVPGGAGLAFGGARAGGAGGVGAVGGELFFGDGRLGRESVLPISEIACGEGRVCGWGGASGGWERIYFVGGGVTGTSGAAARELGGCSASTEADYTPEPSAKLSPPGRVEREKQRGNQVGA